MRGMVAMTRRAEGNLGACMDMANATTRMLLHWEPVVLSDLGSADVYPSIFNYAFSCELYLKAIQMHRSSNCEFALGHDLRFLFDLLEVCDRDDIRAEYERLALDEDGTRKLWALPFDKVIDANRRTFEDWRYAFEKEGLRVQMSCLILLSKAIRTHACKITGYPCPTAPSLTTCED